MQVSAQEYEASTKDPVAAFLTPIASHMNADHADSIMAMLKHYAGIGAQQAVITGLDRCGITQFSEGCAFRYLACSMGHRRRCLVTGLAST